jgi:hypothetical protein
MQWRILNDHRWLMRWTADKLAQKEYVRRVMNVSGLPHLVEIPATLWAGNNIADLQSKADQLPASWVFKPNHSCSRVRLFGPPDSGLPQQNWKELAHLASEWAGHDEEKHVMGHWAYGHARVAMIAEQRIGGSTPPEELKLLCFNGRVHSMMAQEGMGTDAWSVAYYDRSFTQVLSGWEREIPLGQHNLGSRLSKDYQARIIHAAELLTAPFDFTRIDVYLHENQIWFGELTTYSGGGLVAVSDELDLDRGAHWKLPDLHAPELREAEWRSLLETPMVGTLQR